MTTEVPSRRKTLEHIVLTLGWAGQVPTALLARAVPSPCPARASPPGYPGELFPARAGAQGRPGHCVVRGEVQTRNSLKPLSVLSPGIPQRRGSRGENQKEQLKGQSVPARGALWPNPGLLPPARTPLPSRTEQSGWGQLSW